MKKYEGTTGIRNRLLRGQGRSFQVIEAPRGASPSGEAQVIAIAGTSRNYWNCAIFIGNPQFQRSAAHIYGGDSACTPEPPLRFAMVLYYLLWNYRSRGDTTAAGAEALRAVAQKER